MAGDAAAEDQGEFVGLTNGAIGVQEPLLESIGGGEGISKFLQGFRIGALQEGVSTLSKPNATILHTQGQPMMLIETDPSGKGNVGTDPYEDLPPMGVLDIEVVLLYPAPLQL